MARLIDLQKNKPLSLQTPASRTHPFLSCKESASSPGKPLQAAGRGPAGQPACGGLGGSAAGSGSAGTPCGPAEPPTGFSLILPQFPPHCNRPPHQTAPPAAGRFGFAETRGLRPRRRLRRRACGPHPTKIPPTPQKPSPLHPSRQPRGPPTVRTIPRLAPRPPP